MVCKTNDVKDDVVTYVFVIYYPIVVLISQQSKNSYTRVWYALNYSHKGKITVCPRSHKHILKVNKSCRCPTEIAV